MAEYRSLTADQEEQFLKEGFVVVRGALDKTFCREQCDKAFVHLGMDLDDPTTWIEGRLHMDKLDTFSWAEKAPTAWAVICDLLGGEERIQLDTHFSNGMIINFSVGDGNWRSPDDPAVRGWHKDGNFFRHFLDSPEQGLLSIIIWKDIAPRSGGTFYAPDSISVITHLLAAHPEGLKPGEIDANALIAQCHDRREITGEAGDIIFLHPYMLHTASCNPSGTPRIITNPPVSLREPMRFDRRDPADFSPVERCILRALGVERYPFQATGERERYQGGHLEAYEAFMKRRQAER